MSESITAIVNEEQLAYTNSIIPKGRGLNNVDKRLNSQGLVKILLYFTVIDGPYLMWDSTTATAPSGYDIFIDKLNQAKLTHLLLQG